MRLKDLKIFLKEQKDAEDALHASLVEKNFSTKDLKVGDLIYLDVTEMPPPTGFELVPTGDCAFFLGFYNMCYNFTIIKSKGGHTQYNTHGYVSDPDFNSVLQDILYSTNTQVKYYSSEYLTAIILRDGEPLVSFVETWPL